MKRPERAPVLAVDPSWSTPDVRIKELETLLLSERSARERAERALGFIDEYLGKVQWSRGAKTVRVEWDVGDGAPLITEKATISEATAEAMRLYKIMPTKERSPFVQRSTQPALTSEPQRALSSRCHPLRDPRVFEDD